jgi:phage terminase large subunit
MKARKKVVQGGTSAGKTHGIIPILIDQLARTPNLRCTCVAETITSAKKGVAAIFKTVMQETGRWIEDNWIASPMEYRFTNGSVIEFTAYDSIGKAKAAGKRDILFINEANHIPFEIADTLMIRSRETWLDFNADTEFWAHTEVLKEHNSELLILTYEDNEALPEETYVDLMIKKSKAYHDVNGSLDDKDNIKNQHWHNWWKVFGRGMIGNISELRIMPMINAASEVPKEAIEIPSGLDFGWNPDPTAFMRMWIVPHEKGLDDLYIMQVVYDRMLSINADNPEVGNLCDKLLEKKVNPRHRIISENADPRAVSDIRHAHFSIESVKKKTLEASIPVFHEYNIYIIIPAGVEAKDHETYKEFDDYKFDRDKLTNVILGVPKKGQQDHAIDACRYVLMRRDTRWSIKGKTVSLPKAA